MAPSLAILGRCRTIQLTPCHCCRGVCDQAGDVLSLQALLALLFLIIHLILAGQALGWHLPTGGSHLWDLLAEDQLSYEEQRVMATPSEFNTQITILGYYYNKPS